MIIIVQINLDTQKLTNARHNNHFSALSIQLYSLIDNAGILESYCILINYQRQ
jgi:hypothetical protein